MSTVELKPKQIGGHLGVQSVGKLGKSDRIERPDYYIPTHSGCDYKSENNPKLLMLSDLELARREGQREATLRAAVCSVCALWFITEQF